MNPLTRALKLADDPQPELAARTADQSPGSAVRDRGRFGPIRATRDDPVPETLSPPVPAGDEAAARPVDRSDFRSLCRGRGVGRGIGIALSLLAVTGAAAGGGTLLWKTELARPALVGSLPPLAPAVMVPTPVPATNAAGGGAVELAGNGTPPSERSPAVHAAEPRNGGVPAPSTAPGGEGRPVGPTVESAAPMPESSSSGRRAAGTPEVARRIGTERTAPAVERSDAEPPPDAGGRIAIRKRKRPDLVAASLERAYEAYLAGDGEAAGQAYRVVLEHEPRNRDARLGLAAVAARAGRWGEAAEHYATLLASHPADTAARAALAAIAEKDPARAESRLKALLRIEPEAAHLHFSLGNLYAAQSRWPEAQQSWLSAYRLDRGNADHAYNLAVGLDHLSQSRSALDLYREALVLARSSPASFRAEAVLKRIRALESRPDAEPAPDGTAPDEAAAAATAHVR